MSKVEFDLQILDSILDSRSAVAIDAIFSHSESSTLHGVTKIE